MKENKNILNNNEKVYELKSVLFLMLHGSQIRLHGMILIKAKYSPLHMRYDIMRRRPRYDVFTYNNIHAIRIATDVLWTPMFGPGVELEIQSKR